MLRVVVERSSSDMAFQNPEVSYAELLNAVALNYGSLEEASQDLFAHIEVLRKYGFVHVEEGGFPLVYLYWIFSEWPGWDTLRERCAARGATLTDVIVELRFDFLEESS